MNTLTFFGITMLALPALVGAFFFGATRGTLLLRSWFHRDQGPTSHVYPLYSESWLMRCVDVQPVIAAILLFQYRKLVDRIILEIGHTSLHGKRILVTSCAFGNVIPRIVHASLAQHVDRVVLADIVPNELTHAARKLGSLAPQIDFQEENATAMKQASGSVAMNIIFFLLHELPDELKNDALREAARVTAPGGKLVIAEFHRPNSQIMRALSWTYFRVFEPYGLALWDTHDPAEFLEQTGGWSCDRMTCFFGNYQVIIATKHRHIL